MSAYHDSSFESGLPHLVWCSPALSICLRIPFPVNSSIIWFLCPLSSQVIFLSRYQRYFLWYITFFTPCWYWRKSGNGYELSDIWQKLPLCCRIQGQGWTTRIKNLLYLHKALNYRKIYEIITGVHFPSLNIFTSEHPLITALGNYKHLESN